MTALDLQMKKLRDTAVNSITQMAICMREEATDVKATVGDIEDWLYRIKQLAEEVWAKASVYCRYISYFGFGCSSASSQSRKSNFTLKLTRCVSPPASEQHAGRDHLDAERGEAGGLCQSSSQ